MIVLLAVFQKIGQLEFNAANVTKIYETDKGNSVFFLCSSKVFLIFRKLMRS